MQIATVLKSNGTDGELLIGFKGFSAQDIDTKEPVFIEFDGLPVPYFIEAGPLPYAPRITPTLKKRKAWKTLLAGPFWTKRAFRSAPLWE